MAAKPSNIDLLKRALAELSAGKRSLDGKIEGLKRQREELAALPVPREDVIATVDAWLDQCAAGASKKLEASIGFLRTAPLYDFAGRPPLRILEASSHFNRGEVNPETTLGLLASVLRPVLHREIMGWDWPDVVGPPRAERERLLAALDADIERLEAEARGLQAQAAAAGVVL